MSARIVETLTPGRTLIVACAPRRDELELALLYQVAQKLFVEWVQLRKF